jgi:UDP-2-acetamido-3-amino-2,3-dideoxy-glucuronate N-acetyltransferase
MTRPKSKQATVAVIGSGYWGKNLVRVLAGLGALRLICDTNDSVLERFRTEYSGVATCTSFAEVLASDVQAVVIATPAETHFSLASEALLSGKHVMVEKPLALDAKEARALADLARERGLTLMVGHLLHYHPAFLALKKLVGTGEMGRIDYIYSNRLNMGKIRREENILWSFAPHDISMILALTGEQPERVTAVGGNFLHKRIADVTTTHLDFPSGLKAHVFVSWLHPFKEQKLVVVGERKMAVFDDTLPWPEKLVLYSHRVKIDEHGAPVAAKAPSEPVALTPHEPLLAECQHFLACVTGGAVPRTDAEEGLRVLAVLDAAQKSLDGQGRPVSLDEQADPGVMVHETAVVEPGAVLGQGCKIWHFAHILPGTRLGERVNAGQNVVIGPDVTVGSGCKIQNNVSVYKGVTLEEDVFCGPSMVFTNVFNPRAHIRRMDEIRPTLVRKGATLGANCTIVCGVTIGRYALVGAGAVVTRDVPDHAIMTGNPARRTGWVCACGVKLDEHLACPACAVRYARDPQGEGLIQAVQG